MLAQHKFEWMSYQQTASYNCDLRKSERETCFLKQLCGQMYGLQCLSNKAFARNYYMHRKPLIYLSLWLLLDPPNGPSRTFINFACIRDTVNKKAIYSSLFHQIDFLNHRRSAIHVWSGSSRLYWNGTRSLTQLAFKFGEFVPHEQSIRKENIPLPWGSPNAHLPCDVRCKLKAVHYFQAFTHFSG